MRLKFFEKNEIKPVTVVTSNDSNLSGNLNVLSSTQKQTVKQGKSFRSILKKLVHYPFYTEGTRGTGSFKINDVSRGEGEITSRSQGRSSTKSLTATFSGTGEVIRPQDNRFAINYNIDIPRTIFAPFIDILLRYKVGEFQQGFTPDNPERLSLMTGYTDPQYTAKKGVIESGGNLTSGGGVNNTQIVKTIPNTTMSIEHPVTIDGTDYKVRIPYIVSGETTQTVRVHQKGLRFNVLGSDSDISSPDPSTVNVVELVRRSNSAGINLETNFSQAQDEDTELIDGANQFDPQYSGGSISVSEILTRTHRDEDGNLRSRDYDITASATITIGNPIVRSVLGRSNYVFTYSTFSHVLYSPSGSVAFDNRPNDRQEARDRVQDSVNIQRAQRIPQANLIARGYSGYRFTRLSDRTQIENLFFTVSNISDPFNPSSGVDRGYDLTQPILLNNREVEWGTNNHLVNYSGGINHFRSDEGLTRDSEENGVIVLSEDLNRDFIPLIGQGNGLNLSREGVNQTIFPILVEYNDIGYEFLGLDDMNRFIIRRDDNQAISVGEIPQVRFIEDGVTRDVALVLQEGGILRGQNVSYYTNTILSSKFIFEFLTLRQWARTTSRDNARFTLVHEEIKYFLNFVGSGQSTAEGESTINFNLQDMDHEFPDVSIQIDYLETSQKLELRLNRNHEFAPIPDKEFFDTVQIKTRTFNFSSSEYSANETTGDAIYLFNSATPPVSDTDTTFSLTFTKSGTSFTRAFDIERVVKKSTIRQEQSKDLPRIVNGLKLSDISFGDDFFEIEFDEVNLSASSFDCIQILSGSQEVTRQMRSSDATISGGNTFRWEGLEEFVEIKKNKTYTLEILKGGYCEVDKLFIPNPSGDYHFIENMAYADGKLSFNLRNNTSSPLSDNPFNSIRIIQSSVTFLSPKVFSDFFIEDGAYTLETPLSFTNGTYDFYIEVEDLPLFSLTLTQLTDFVFDTIVIQDTNIDQLSITDQLNRELIHPSDIREIKAITEGGERGFVIFLNNPVVSPVINLNNRSVFNKIGQRNFGKVFLFKQIGSFTKFPLINVFIDSTKTTYKTQTGQTHVKTLPESFRYSLDFGSSPLDQVSDLRLAEDLFSRLSDYNEFVVWVNGGVDTSSNKFNNMKGFRFKDIVQVLTTNNWSYRFQEGRLSSGLNFVMEISEVPL